MRSLILIVVLLSLMSCVESSKPISYEQVPVKVVFLDGKVDTLMLSGNHDLVYNRLVEYPNQTSSERIVAYGVKYVKRIKHLETKDKNQ